MIRINERIDNLRELLTSALEANLSLISVSQERGYEAARRLGRDHRRADHGGGHLRHELQLHARAPGVGYPGLGMMASACGALYAGFKRSRVRFRVDPDHVTGSPSANRASPLSADSAHPPRSRTSAPSPL